MSSAHRIVSSEAEELILVDENDNEAGYLSKAECHDGDGVLHRAFSLFLFDDAGRVLLQQRAGTKRLWPEYWSNSCCSHPRRGESMHIATERRLRDELNTEAQLEYVYKFSYRARFDDAGSENELCHIFVGRLHGDVKPNEHEIENIRFVSRKELDAELAAKPERFTPWLKMEWRTLCEQHASLLSRYAM